MTLHRRQISRPSQEKKCKKTKWFSEETLQIAVGEKKDAKGKGEKERYSHLTAEFQRIAKKDKKALGKQWNGKD